MKKVQSLVIIVLICFGMPAFAAGPDWVARFLDRYRPAANPLSTSPAPQTTPSLFQGGTDDRALSAKQLSLAQLNAQAQQIALDVRNAMNQVEMNRAHIQSAQKARELAEQTLDAEQKKFELGVSTLFFVLQQQTNLAAAETNEIQALVSYVKALVALDRATGQTLTHNNIEIEKANPRLAVNAAN